MMKKPTESGKIVKNATWLIACKVVQSLLSFVIGTLSARYLGPGNYGIIDYAAAIVSFMVPVVQLGLRSTLVHEIIAAPDSEGRTLGTSLFMSTTASFLGIFGVIAFTAIANPNDPETMLVCALYSICATPHFYPHKESVSSFIERRGQTADNLWAQIPADAPRVLLGAEVLICDGMERLNGLRELCLEGTNELLLEMPFYRWPAPIWDTLYRLNDLRDIQIVIAHADRYPPEDIHPLISEGIPLQLNAECLRKHLHRKRYLEWIQKGYVSYLGSDIHEFGSGYHDFEKCRKLLCRYL